MDSLRQSIRESILLEMYASVRRQTRYILVGNVAGTVAETHLQQNQRGRFELFVEEAE